MRDGISRRAFLGAAAVAWELPWSNQGDSQPASAGDGDASPRREQESRERRHGGFNGSVVMEDHAETSISVKTYPHQVETPVALTLSLGAVSVDAVLEPDEARDLAESLRSAAEDAEQWREDNWSDLEKERYSEAGRSTRGSEP